MSNCATSVITKRKGRLHSNDSNKMAIFSEVGGGFRKLSGVLAVSLVVVVFSVFLPVFAQSMPVGQPENWKSNLNNPSEQKPTTSYRHHRQIRHLHQQQRRHAASSSLLESDKDFLLPETDTISSHERLESTSKGEREFLGEKDIADGFWVRIAQAKVLALAVENGTLPKLDEYSEIMKPAGCRIDHDTDCHVFTTTCAEKQANQILQNLAAQHAKPSRDNVTLYMLTILRECGFHGFRSYTPLTEVLPTDTQWSLVLPPTQVPQPQAVFHCNSHIGQDSTVSNFRMEYEGNQIPQNISNDLVPRYFLIETQKKGGKWGLSDRGAVSAYWLNRFSTKTDETFRIRVTAVSPKFVYPPVTSPLIRIYNREVLQIDNPTNLRVVNITVDDTAARPRPSALIRWNSGSGLNASCDFDVYYMDEDVEVVERKKGDDAFWVKLDKLHFERNYTLRVIEKFATRKETEVKSHLYIPSCLEMRKFSFELCSPPPPTNVHIENTTEHSFWVKWNAPKYVNETNRILYYNLTVDWIYSTVTPAASPTGPMVPDALLHGSISPIAPPSASTSLHATGHTRASPLSTLRIFSENIPGNQTFVHITNVTQLRGQFKVTVTAIGAAGPSPSRWYVVTYKGLPISDWTLRKILTLVFALVGVVALVSLFCVLKHFHERHQRKKKRQEKFENYEKESLQLQQINYRDSTKWEIECCNLDVKEGIGKGNFGLVRRAILNQRGKKMVVAVKTLRDGVNEKDVDKLWEEYEILKNLDPHVHVVGLKGIVTKHVPFPLLVVEYCDGGDLQSHLRKVVESMDFSGQRRYHAGSVLSSGSSATSSIVNLATGNSTTNSSGHHHSHVRDRETPSVMAGSPGNSSARIVTNAAYFLRNEVDGAEPKPQLPALTIADLLSYSRQIACGMEYLSNNKIVHRDLAARNILISGKSRILKISDFGLSRDVYEQNWYKRSSKGEIPFKWLAIESILNEIYTTKSDVWSYGILLWEIFTYGGNPYPGVDNLKVFELLKDGYRMPRPDTCPVELYELMRLCWDDDPGKRPDFTGTRLILEEIIEKTTHVTYLNLDTSNSSSKGGGGSTTGSHYYKNCDSGFEEYDGSTGCEPILPPRNKKKFG